MMTQEDKNNEKTLKIKMIPNQARIIPNRIGATK